MSPPGKNERLHDVGIGREGEPPGVDVEQGAVVQGREIRVVERRQQHALDQVLRQASAAAVRQEHARVLVERQRAFREEGHRAAPCRA